MDLALEAAGRALAQYEPLIALKHVALRDDGQALALRGVAMAQLGDLVAAKKLISRAASLLAQGAPRGHARCLAALGEIALESRELKQAGKALDAAVRELEALGDRTNTLFVQVLRIRRHLMLGAIDEASALHRSLKLSGASPRLRAVSDLVGAEIAMRKLEPRRARALLHRAGHTARAVEIAPLLSEIDRAKQALGAPVARVVRGGVERYANLDEVEGLLSERAFVVDACRRTVHVAGSQVSLVSRPVLLSLLLELATAHPADVRREALAGAAFGIRRMTDSARVRLRVEIGRLRKLVAAHANVHATKAGYVLRPRRDRDVVALLAPAPGEESALLALLRGGEAWSTSALASALGTSQRSVQRALSTLLQAKRVESTGRGRTQRWVAPAPRGFATTLLLVARTRDG